MRFDRDETSVLETQKTLKSEKVVRLDRSPDIAHNIDEQQVLEKCSFIVLVC